MWPDQTLIEAVSNSQSRIVIFELMLLGIFGVMVVVLLNFVRAASRRESSMSSLIESRTKVDSQLVTVIRENSAAFHATAEKLSASSAEAARQHASTLDKLREISLEQDTIFSEVTNFREEAQTSAREAKAAVETLRGIMEKNLEISLRLLEILELLRKGEAEA